MKKLLILLLIVGLAFGDTIKIEFQRTDTEGEVETYTSEKKGEYVGILDAKAYLRTPDGNLEEFNCLDIVFIFDNEKKPILYDCSTNTFIPKTLTELDIKKIQKKSVFGGSLIAIGGFLVFSTYSDDCSDCNLSDFKKVSNKQRIGFSLIAIGGLLVAVGI